MFWELDPKHVAIITEKKADTEGCLLLEFAVSSAVTLELGKALENNLCRNSI